MASTINATTSSGIVATADNTGQLALQANGTTIATISSTGVAVTGTISSNGINTSPYTMKNRIINGGMTVDQRNAGASVTPTSSAYTLDRWEATVSAASKYSVIQNTNSTAGYNTTGQYYSLLATSLSAYTVGASEAFTLTQYIEGYNVADMMFGTSGAKTFTLSFWVYSSLTGTFGGAFQNSGRTRSYPFTYTISAANTWEQKTITVTGDTTGTWLTTNGRGLNVIFSLGAGSTLSGTAGAWATATYYSATGATSVVGTNGATFYITGVQLEVGSSATSFEWRPYGTELALCQRYHQQLGSAVGVAAAANLFTGAMQFFVPMRTSPTLSVSAAMTVTDTNAADYTQSSAAVSIVSGNRVNNLGVNFSLTNLSGMTTNKVFITIPTAYSNGIISASAEL